MFRNGPRGPIVKVNFFIIMNLVRYMAFWVLKQLKLCMWFGFPSGILEQTLYASHVLFYPKEEFIYFTKKMVPMGCLTTWVGNWFVVD